MVQHHNHLVFASPQYPVGVSYFLQIKYLTVIMVIGGLSLSLCVKSVRNQHIFLKKNARDIWEKFKIPLLFHNFLPNFYFP